jgi:hypothetical protein
VFSRSAAMAIPPNTRAAITGTSPRKSAVIKTPEHLENI